MKNKKVFYTVGFVLSLILMFVWIFLTVFLTGQREINEFTSVDKYIFTGFIIVEIITVVVLSFMTSRLAKIVAANKPPQTQVPQEQTKTHAKAVAQGTAVLIGCFILGLVALAAGVFVGNKVTDNETTVFGIAFVVCLLIDVVCIILNHILPQTFIKKMEKLNVEEMQNFLLSHREFAKETAEKKIALLKKIILVTDVYSVTLSIIGITAAFCTGVVWKGDAMFFIFLSFAMILVGADRIRFPASKEVFSDEKGYVDPKDFPTLHVLAEKAEKELGIEGEIRIFLSDDFNAGIAKIGNVYSVQLGAVLLNFLSQDEIYQVLLHEFGHFSDATKDELYINNYYRWLIGEGNVHFLSEITHLFYKYSDETLFGFNHFLYTYASSVMRESQADEVMKEHGDVVAAASGFLKLKYFALYSYENESYDKPCYTEEEKAPVNYVTKDIESFGKALELRKDFWSGLVNVEILPRTASHPTTKMRLEALGVTDPCLLPYGGQPQYIEECKKAIKHVEDVQFEINKEMREVYLNAYFTEPMKKVTAWEEAGKPLIMEEYADIECALRFLGRMSEAIELCDRAINELDGVAITHALYIKGVYLLHKYDPQGIDLIYKAIENNNNYLQEGLEQIGAFACITGRQEDLDNYRQRAVVMAQKDKDEFSLANFIDVKDNLSEEKLPDEMLEKILSYIKKIDENTSIETIRLIRKNISDNFFSSVVLIKFKKTAEEEEKQVIMQKTFNHLDAGYEWQFSLFDFDTLSAPLRTKIEKINNSCVYSDQ